MRLQTLRFERDGRSARVTLDRPRAMNAITMAMLAELQAVCEWVEQDEEIRALVVTGSGEAFSVGAGIELLERAFGDHAEFRRFLEQVNRTLLRVEALPVPVVAAVNGLARAGGFEPPPAGAWERKKRLRIAAAPRTPAGERVPGMVATRRRGVSRLASMENACSGSSGAVATTAGTPSSGGRGRCHPPRPARRHPVARERPARRGATLSAGPAYGSWRCMRSIAR
jgi:hypothetical protein